MQTEKLFGGNHISSKLEQGDDLPISISAFSDATPTTVKLDFDKCGDFFAACEQFQAAIDRPEFQPKLNALMTSTGLDKDNPAHRNFFITAIKFTSGLVSVCPVAKSNDINRKKIVSRREQLVLSQLVTSKATMCTEYAALACKYFQDKDVPASLVVGSRTTGIGDGDDVDGDAGAHAFLVVELSDKILVFDPAATSKSCTPGRLNAPAFFEVSRQDFEAWKVRAKDEPCYFSARNAYNNKTCWYFGVDLALTTGFVEPGQVIGYSQPQMALETPAKAISAPSALVSGKSTQNG